jgi:transcriptional regulator with XRE-family HTH domain
MSLGTRLRAARTYRGFSQEEVAKHLGVSRPSVSLVENGLRGVDTLELKKLSELFECSIDELVGREEPPAVDPPSIAMVARAAAQLSPEDRDEVLRFAKFLRTRKRRKTE